MPDATFQDGPEPFAPSYNPFEPGWFEQTIAATISSKYQKAALVHVDSDLYASARCVLEGVAPILSNGGLVLFDDWFMYKGDPNEGEARASRVSPRTLGVGGDPLPGVFGVLRSFCASASASAGSGPSWGARSRQTPAALRTQAL